MKLTDGQWHRLHPATPLLRGGIALIAVAGVIIANLRERLVELFFHVPSFGEDPVDEIYNRGLVGWALLGVLVVILGIIVVFYFSWRMHTFRVTDEVVEVRSGLLFRVHRRVRLDRIQGVTVSRQLFARIFGAAKLDISAAGQDANVQLAYLSGRLADELRAEILRLASGARRAAQPRPVPGDPAGAGGQAVASADAPDAAARAGLGAIVQQRFDEFTAPELDPALAAPESVVRIPVGRLIGSVVLSGFTLFIIVVGIGMIVGVANGSFWPLFAFLPALIGGISYYTNRTTRLLRFSIAGTPDGVRVGYGLLSTNNETLPPGRIHAIGVSQPLLWRPFGWWKVQLNTAGRPSGGDRQARESTTVLPVGTVADVRRVLELMLPAFADEGAEGVIETGLISRGGADGYTGAPRRAAWLRPFSWRRTGFRRVGGVLLLRHGILSRDLAVVPLARLQSVGLVQGPVQRLLRLGGVRLHTVSGPVSAAIEVVDAAEATALFEQTATDAVLYARTDTTHHWGAS